jgi:hypothetical protein
MLEPDRPKARNTTREDEFDRRVPILLIALALAAILVNVDRFAQGTAGYQRAHDGGDFNITNFVSCGELWRLHDGSSWNASVLRGWPTSYGSYAPQHLGCVLAAAVPIPTIYPILQCTVLVILATGSFLFLLRVLRYPLWASFAGALFNVALYYWFHEHDLVTSATLLLPLIGYLSLSGSACWKAVRLVGLLLIIWVSNPPNTLLLMPIAHAAAIILLPGGTRRRQLRLWAGFWLAYGLFYAPTLLAYASELARSNRALFHGTVPSQGLLAALRGNLYNNAAISPGLVLLCLVSRRTWRTTLAALLAMAGIVVAFTLNAHFVTGILGARWPVVMAVSTSYYRFYYMTSVVVFVWGSALLRDAMEERGAAASIRRVVLLVALCFPVARVIMSGNPGTFALFDKYALLIGAFFVAYCALPVRRAVVALPIALALMVPLRIWYLQGWESPLQGNLFLEEKRDYGVATPLRFATVIKTCDASDIFPAQAEVHGFETLDGISNFYDRAFAERWQFYVTEGTGSCTKRFRYWSTRVEITAEDWRSANDRIFRWLWINNVSLVRSAVPLEDDRLELVESKPYVIHWFGSVTRYVYRVKDPLGRVFRTARAVADQLAATKGDLRQESVLLRRAAESGAFSSVPVSQYSAGRLTFAGDFGQTDVLSASINFHPGWTLYVDGKKVPEGVREGNFGMLSFSPMAGRHEYVLAFEASDRLFITLSALISLALLAVLTAREEALA